MNELAAIFGDFEGIKEDLMNFGIMGLSAVAGHVAVGFIMPYIPASVPSWAGNAGIAVLGVIAGHFASKYVDARVGNGLAVGMVAAGLTGLIKEFLPSIPLAATDSTMLLGLGDGPDAQRYLGDGGTGLAPTSIEDGGTGTAPLSIEGFDAAEEDGDDNSYVAALQ